LLIYFITLISFIRHLLKHSIYTYLVLFTAYLRVCLLVSYLYII